MENQTYPILEYDPTPEALIEPSKLVQPVDAPEHCIICFFQEVVTQLSERKGTKIIAHHPWSDFVRPLYEIDADGRRLAVVHPGIGASLTAAILEEVIARGCRKFIACGGAGVLNREITIGHLVIPNIAVRDEGTSYHYLPPGREVSASPEAVQAIKKVLQDQQIPYLIGKTWTTDGPYRETREKIRLRKKEGCLTVEMEAAAFFAVAKFREVIFGQILYGGDDVSGEIWDSRQWHSRTSVREQLFWLAAEACLLI
jgi:uridine phosphorylase